MHSPSTRTTGEAVDAMRSPLPTESAPADAAAWRPLGVLPDGTPITARPLRPDDHCWWAEWGAGLSPRSVYRRFLSGYSLPPVRLLDRLLDAVDGQRHVAVVAAAPAAVSPAPAPPSWPDRTTVPVAITRFVRADDDPTTAHVACTVIDAWHGRGVGTLLIKELISWALALGVTTFTATVDAENRASLQVLKKAGRIDRWERAGGVVEVSIALGRAGRDDQG